LALRARANATTAAARHYLLDVSRAIGRHEALDGHVIEHAGNAAGAASSAGTRQRVTAGGIRFFGVGLARALRHNSR